MSQVPPSDTQPLVTVMIPTYRQPELVLRAVDSALLQDYPHLQVLVSDDASPDDTAARVATRRDARLAFHRSEVNRGRVGNYRHMLYALAEGAWVVNLDADDYFTDPSFISKAMEQAMAGPDVVMVCARITVRSAGSGYETRVPPAALVEGSEVVLGFHRQEFRFAHMATLYRRAVALQCDFYRMNVLSADWESLCRLAVHGNVAYLDRVAGVWDVGLTSASETANWRAWRDNLDIWTSIAAALRDRGIPAQRVAAATRAIRDSFAQQYFGIVLRAGPADPLRYWWSLRSLSCSAMVRILFSWRAWAHYARRLAGALVPRRLAAFLSGKSAA
jgi:glycosyltransferase involved in cell wall biosynthesis